MDGPTSGAADRHHRLIQLVGWHRTKIDADHPYLLLLVQEAKQNIERRDDNMATTRVSKRSHDSVNEKSVDVTTSRKSPKRSKRTTPVQVTPEKDPKSENGLKDTDIPIYVDKILKDAGIENTKTRSGWCLKEGMIHILKADSGRMFPLVKQHGVPKVFASLGHCKNDNGEVEESGKQPETCFQSLCRIVVGAQVNTNAASAFWTGLLRATDGQLTPKRVLQIEKEKGLKNGIQAPARISASKAKYIWNIAKAFEKGGLSEEMLLNSDETKIREMPIKVSGIGPWSCDMFCMFYLKLPGKNHCQYVYCTSLWSTHRVHSNFNLSKRRISHW